jgi:ferritin
MYFDRDDVALPGFHKFFAKMSAEERDHAEKFMKYQNQRGGRIVLQNIQVLPTIYCLCFNIVHSPKFTKPGIRWSEFIINN